MHNVLSRPLPGVPPYGPGYLPARGPVGRLRDAVGRAIVNIVHVRNGGPSLNRARVLLGLPSLDCPFEQYDRADRVLVLTSEAFDYQALLADERSLCRHTFRRHGLAAMESSVAC